MTRFSVGHQVTLISDLANKNILSIKAATQKKKERQFPRKGKIREFITTKLPLKEILKGTLSEGKKEQNKTKNEEKNLQK